MKHKNERKIRITSIIIMGVLIAIIHFLPKPECTNPLTTLYNFYFIDIILPCYFYLILTLNTYSLPIKFRRRRKFVKSVFGLIVLSACFMIETMQFLGYKILGQTFDPMDYVMYFGGVLLGFVCDYVIIWYPRNNVTSKGS